MDILAETDSFLVINKTAGLLVEQSPYYDSVEAQALQYFSKTKKKPFAGIVHRLDRPVSGALLMAKKKSTLKTLNEQFSRRSVQKIYLALVAAPPPGKSGELCHWLKKDQKNKRAEVFETPVKEVTECRLSYRLLAQNLSAYLLEIIPFSGKFHQIRAQLSAAGCPILGDEKYGSRSDYLPEAIALHAWKLSFQNPENEAQVQVVAPPPDNHFWNPFLEKF